MNHQIRHMIKSLALCAFGFLICISEADAAQIQIVAFGTSFTAGKGVETSKAYPAQLESILKSGGDDVRIANQGVNGNTTRDLLGRISDAVPENTDIVILEYAIGNDTKRRISREDTVKNVGEIISRLTARKIQVLLLIRGRNKDQVEKRTSWFRETIAKFGIAFFPIEQPPSTLLSDGRHPTAESHRSIAESMAPTVKRLIELAKATGKQ